MSFLFDNGDTLPLQSRIAEGFIALLEPLRLDAGDPATGRGPYFKTVSQIAWTPDDKYIETLGHDALGILPSALVQVMGAQAETVEPERIVWRYGVAVHIFSGFAGQLVDGRLDPSVETLNDDPGIRVMLDHVIEQLHFHVLPTCPTSQAIKLLQVRHGKTTPGWTHWWLETEIMVQQYVSMDRNAVPLDAVTVTHAVQDKGVIITQRRV